MTGQKYNDPDAMAMAAESYMNLSPWDYYLPVSITTEAACNAQASVCDPARVAKRVSQARDRL